MNPYAHPHTRKAATRIASVLIFGLTLSALYSVGLVPDYVDGTGGFAKESPRALPDSEGRLALNDIPQLGDEVVLQPMSALEAAARALREEMGETSIVRPPVIPTKISIPAVSIEVPILNPESTEVEALDKALYSGVVRYPLSAQLNEEGNVFIFGHSSHLPVVHNQMFKAFNNIENLKVGDAIRLSGKNDSGVEETHIYHVTSVRQADATEAMIDISRNGKKRLTLSTCDSFTGKTARWVVEAEFVGIAE